MLGRIGAYTSGKPAGDVRASTECIWTKSATSARSCRPFLSPRPPLQYCILRREHPCGRVIQGTGSLISHLSKIRPHSPRLVVFPASLVGLVEPAYDFGKMFRYPFSNDVGIDDAQLPSDCRHDVGTEPRCGLALVLITHRAAFSPCRLGHLTARASDCRRGFKTQRQRNPQSNDQTPKIKRGPIQRPPTERRRFRG
jgi:hypothetical protein